MLSEEAHARAETSSRVTVEQLIDDYVKRGISKLRSRHVVEVRLRRALRTLLSRPAADVTKRDIRDLLDAVSDRGRNAEADSQRQAIGALFRFGVRGGQLAFGVGKTPTEFGYSAGLGRQFAGGRGRLDLGLERLERKGTGLNERVWTFLLGLTVRP